MCKSAGFLLILLLFTNCYSQFKTDFMIADSGATPYFDFDKDGKLHMVWQNAQKTEHSIQYSIFDDFGNVINQKRKISITQAAINPSLAIKNNYVACIWDDKVSLDITVFSTYIKGKIIKNGVDFSNEIEFDDGDIVPNDALRYTPQVIWYNDSILYSVWAGYGSRSFVQYYSDIYKHKLLFPPLQKGYPLDTVMNNSWVKVTEMLPTVVKRSSGSGYLSIWVEKDSLSILRIAGVTCDDSLNPISTKIVFVNLDSVKYYISKPAIFHKKNGDIIIVWEKDTANFQANIFYQEFTEQGTPVGNITKVNDKLASSTSSTVADIDSLGRFIIVWEEYPNLMAQRYSSNGIKIGNNFKLNQTQTNADFYPVVRLRNNKIYTAWTRADINSATSVWMSILDFDNPTMVVDEKIKYPNCYLLFQNYPNPFNPSTTITFSLPRANNVTLKVFDVLGREVATLVNEYTSIGLHRVEFNGSSVASGIYLYRLQTDGYTETKKLVLMK